MERRSIGSMEVSVVGLGCNAFGDAVDAETAATVVHAALDAGVTLFDTADSYGGTQSEELLGRALDGLRDRALIATKFGMPLDENRPGGGRPEYVRAAVEGSLRRLRTDYIDLYQLHVPDPDVPIAETLGALNDLVVDGKVREIGCSNFSVEELRAAAAAAAADAAAYFASVQSEYSLLRRNAETTLLPECERLGMAFLPYYPLASGVLTGKYRRGEAPPAGSRLAPGGRAGATFAARTPALVEALRLGRLPPLPRRRQLLSERTLDLVESLIEFASARGRTILELGVSWLLTRGVVASVIAGATRPEQVKANSAAAGWQLTAEELRQVDAILADADTPAPARPTIPS
jgi:aryl-alcohol dehydrogenase-like predicted oxidoreductase